MIDVSNRIGREFRKLFASFAPPSAAAIPVWFASPDNWEALREAIGASAARFAAACGFEPKAGRLQWLPDAEGGLAGVLFGLADRDARGRDPMAPGKLASALPAGTYRFANAPHEPELAALAFLLGALSLRALPRRPGAPAAPGRARRASTRRGSSVSPRRSPSAATSSTRPPTTSGPARWKARPRAWPKNSAPASK